MCILFAINRHCFLCRTVGNVFYIISPAASENQLYTALASSLETVPKKKKKTQQKQTNKNTHQKTKNPNKQTKKNQTLRLNYANTFKTKMFLDCVLLWHSLLEGNNQLFHWSRCCQATRQLCLNFRKSGSRWCLDNSYTMKQHYQNLMKKIKKWWWWYILKCLLYCVVAVGNQVEVP